MKESLSKPFNRYIHYLQAERNFSPYTVRNYTTDLLGSRNIKGFFGFLVSRGINSPDDVDRAVLRDYLGYLIGQGVVKGSIARRLSAIRSFYRYLLREGIVDSDPLEEAVSPKLDRRLPSFLSIDEVKRLIEIPDLSSPEGLRNRALLELLYASGLRVSELARLDLENINLEAREIRVWGKGSRERMVLMGQPATMALSTYLTQGRSKLAGKKANNALFLNRYGQRLRERHVQKLVGKYARMAGIERRVYPHMLRHTFATHMLDGGANLRVVQNLLGHASLSSTQIYTHISRTRAKEVYKSAHPLAKEKGERN